MSIYDVTVTFECPQYKEYKDIWDQIDDCVKGSKWVKDKGETYLPKPNAADKSQANQLRYAAYVMRALFMNATGRTLDTMVGMVSSKPAMIDLPPSLEYLNEDSDGNGLSLNQHANGTVEQVSAKGRNGLLVDFPQTDEAVTLLDRQNGTRAYIVSYTAQNIINWRTRKFGAVNKISLIVLREQNETLNTFYASELNDTYRVLWLDEDGYYNQAVMNLVTSDKTKKLEVIPETESQPRDANGNRFTEIPFVFVGSKNNDYRIDDAPLYDISEVNLAHYRDSADNKESSFLVGQPTLFLYTSKSEEELAQCNNGCGIQFGSRAANVLEPDDKVELVQAEPNNLPKENMKDEEEQMAQLGARLISPSKQQTAEAARINYGAETSTLSTIVQNVNDAYRDCIRWCEQFNTGNQDIEFTFALNSEFFHEKVNPQEITALMAAVQSGQLPQQDFLSMMIKSGYISEDREIEDIIDDLETQEPTV